ncbi:hypothetical protein PB01_10810 [Psychrobacillus glaciei]|uniref:Uncharacterized protein n=1 Tax=Psychrobacillus glaciei TaxID=2283160 RepID=A0A5J6SMX7_9BACI|nr:hypothetical protein [Psychrobacillus glaciei]QFF99276.1 hypothetical protein PB01_10810 [Psychrobacillus glaciei]
MSKKLKIISITAILLGIIFINLALKDDVQEIKKVMYSLNQPMTNIAHIEFLDNNQAIAFYEWGNHQDLFFGSALFKKNLFGWKLVTSFAGGLSHEHKLDWGISNLESSFYGYTDLIRGKILDPQIEEVNIKTDGGNEFKANIIEYGDDQKFWFLVTDGEDLIGTTITGLSSDGKIIEQIIQ